MYGSNKWENSNIREWLNSNDVEVNYTTQAPTKKAVWNGYNAYSHEAGLLTNFSSSEIDKIEFYKHDRVEDRIFLLSKNELKKLFSDKSARIKYLTKLAADNSDYKNENVTEKGKYWYWTRTPSPVSSNRVYDVDGDGSFYDYWLSACYGNSGVVPALYLKSDICESGKGSKKEPYIV